MTESIVHELTTARLGDIKVFVQGNLSGGDVTILTVHDLGCNHNHYEDFLIHPKMVPLAERTVWVHVELPGQGDNAADLPPEFVFPTMQEIADDLVEILDKLNIKYVVVFGEGAGANILARFAISHEQRVLGAVLIHCTGSTAGFLESMKDKFIGKKLENEGMNTSAESYLVLHRFGSEKQAAQHQELAEVVKCFRHSLRNSLNPRNLQKFISTFMNRTNLSERITNLKCPVLFVTGGLAQHKKQVVFLYETVLKALKDNPQMRSKIELIQIDNVANVITEKPEKVSECLLYFLQGIGYLGHLRIGNEPLRLNRRMSMEDYDRPKGRNSFGSGMTAMLPIPAAPESEEALVE